MPFSVWIVDAFSEQAFGGNPAGVTVVNEPLSPDLMQQVAAEMNLSETAFLWPEDGAYRLRWFTPTVEVDLCGHATLGAAHVLYELGRFAPSERIVFNTRSGALQAEKRPHGICLDFPSEVAEAVESHAGIMRLFGDQVCWIGRNRMDWIVEVLEPEFLREYDPDLAGIRELGLRGLIVTSKSDVPEADFLSRFFAPQSGVPEDPVTGSAHCCLGPYWAAQLAKAELVGHQVSRRGGTVRVLVRRERVTLIGHAKTVLRGEFLC